MDLLLRTVGTYSISLPVTSTYADKRLWPNASAPPIQHFRVKLWTYTGEELKVLGAAKVDVVSFEEQKQNLELVIVAGDGPSLMGRDWLMKIH